MKKKHPELEQSFSRESEKCLKLSEKGLNFGYEETQGQVHFQNPTIGVCFLIYQQFPMIFNVELFSDDSKIVLKQLLYQIHSLSLLVTFLKGAL